MRDISQMREKVELSLESQQIAALAFGALVLLCSVFALGLALGRRLAEEAPRPLELSALDAQATVPEQKKPLAEAPPAEKPGRKAEPVRIAAVGEAPASEGSRGETVIPAPRKTLVVPAPPRVQDSRAIVLTPPPRDLGAYTVQIGASPDRAEAQRLELKARAAGLKPYVVEANLGAKGTWYRVRVGSFSDKERAALFRGDVERELRASAVVMASH
jgi:cell division septation protein DedD